MPWHKVPDPELSTFIKWGQVSPPFTLEGVWCGPRSSDYGEFGEIEFPDGMRQRFSLPTMLSKRLALVDPGLRIKIQYDGTRPMETGEGFYHCFTVYSESPVALPGALLKAGVAPVSGEAPHDEAPL